RWGTQYWLAGARFGSRMGNIEVVDGMYRDGFLCPLCGQLMGETAENLVREYGILRAEQDAYAAESQRRAADAAAAGRFADEIAPVSVAGKKGSVSISADEHPRPDSTAEAMAKLTPVFDPEGTVHAGNSSGITDGAAALVLATEEEVAKAGVEPLGRVAAWVSAGVDPARMGIGPVPAIRALLEKTKLRLSRGDPIRLDEAFAAPGSSCAR